MKVVQINTTCGVGSTGSICTGISKILTSDNAENYIIYSCRSNDYEYGIQCSNYVYSKFQALKSRVLGNYGLNSRKATYNIISELDRIHPDIVHIHNIHGHDCDIELLFDYFRKNRTKLIWTFHYCWTFTAYCPHFSMAKCDLWKTQCSSCVQRREYSWFFDRSSEIFDRKKKAFEKLDLTIVTPSQWLADQVRQSFLQSYPVEVIYNGVDIDLFGPIDSNFRTKYGVENKKLILGVAFDWGKRKGFDVFLELEKRLSKEYKIVLVGTDNNVSKKLPQNIISIHRTQNQRELAEIYAAADVFINPTREEVLGLVNIEALACGTPGITFRSGGSPECYDETCGSVVDCDDIDALEKEIIRICTEKPYTKEACVKKAKEFDKNERFKEYVELYERINASRT